MSLASGLSLVAWHSSHVDGAKGSNPLSVPAGTTVMLSTRPYGVLWVVFATVWMVPAGTMDTLAKRGHGTGSTAPTGGSRFASYRPGQLSP